MVVVVVVVVYTRGIRGEEGQQGFCTKRRGFAGPSPSKNRTDLGREGMPGQGTYLPTHLLSYPPGRTCVWSATCGL